MLYDELRAPTFFGTSPIPHGNSLVPSSERGGNGDDGGGVDPGVRQSSQRGSAGGGGQAWHRSQGLPRGESQRAGDRGDAVPLRRRPDRLAADRRRQSGRHH